MKIKTRIVTTFVGVFVLVIIAIGGFLIYETDTVLIARMEDSVTISSNAKAKHIETYLQGQRETISMFAASQVFRDFLNTNPTASGYATAKQKAVTRMVRSVAVDKSYYEMFLLDKNGIIVASTDPNEEGKNKINDTYFTQAQKESYIKDVYFSETTKQITYALSAPVLDDTTNKLLGVVVLRADMTDLIAILHDLNGLGQTAENFLINRDKYLLTPSQFLDQSKVLTYKVDTVNTNECFGNQEISEKESGSTTDEPAQEYKDYRGVDIIGAHNYMPDVGWCLITKVDKSELYQPITKITAYLIATSLGGVAIFTILGFILSRNISRPIENLSKDVNKISESGDLDQKVATVSNDEVGELSRVFDKMTASIKASRAEIESKVFEQTREIVEKGKDLEDQQKAILNILEDVDAEKEIASTEKVKYEALLTGIGDGVIATDNETKIIVMNPEAEKILGWKKEEVTGKKLTDVIAVVDDKGNPLPDPERPIIKAISEMKHFTTSVNSNYNYVAKDGKIIPVFLNAAPVVVNGKLFGAINIFHDITHEKDIDRMKTEFISLSSHQLRTPLSAIKWFGEMLLAGDAGTLLPEQKEFVDNIAQSTERMIALVNSLLNISRIESGRIIIDPAPTHLPDLVADVIKEVQIKLNEKKQHLITSFHPDLPKINIDPKLIREVYKNLLTNSIKYTPEGGDISVFISKNEKEIVSQVTDSGYGIPEKDQKKVFEKFYRGENIVKLETEGTGLGLYLVKAVIESSGGRVWFSSKVGSASGGESKGESGTTFWFALPLTGSVAKSGEVAINS